MADKNQKKKNNTTQPVAVAPRKGPNPNRRNGKAPKKNPKSNPHPLDAKGQFGYSHKRLGAMATARGGDLSGVLLVLKTQEEHKDLARRRRPRQVKSGQRHKMDGIKQQSKLLAPEAREARRKARIEREEAARRAMLEAKREAQQRAAQLAAVAMASAA